MRVINYRRFDYENNKNTFDSYVFNVNRWLSIEKPPQSLKVEVTCSEHKKNNRSKINSE